MQSPELSEVVVLRDTGALVTGTAFGADMGSPFSEVTAIVEVSGQLNGLAATRAARPQIVT